MKRLVVLFLAGALVISACGDDDDDGDSQSTQTSRQSSASRPSPTSAPSSTAAAGPATVRAGSTTQYGEILVDADGKSLYLFANDTGTTSAVSEGVLAAWPPIVVEGEPTAGEGLDQSKIGAAEQPNGERWVTYNGHILYRFANDAAPGDTNGQGLGNVWYLVSAEGERIG